MKISIKQKNAVKVFYRYLHKSIEKDFLDPTNVLRGDISIDIVKFNDYIIEEYGYNIEKDGSLKKFLTYKFSPELAKAVETLI